MSELERELAAALKAKSASVTPDPDAWNKHRGAALTQPAITSRRRLGRRRVLPLVIAATVVLVAAVGTSILVTSNSSAPASAPTPTTGQAAPRTTTSPTVNTSHAAIPVAPPSPAASTGSVPPQACTGNLLGSAQLTPAGVTGFTAQLQLRRATSGDLLCAGIQGVAGRTVQTSTGGTVNGAGPMDLAASSTWDQGSPVFVWGAVDSRVAEVHIAGANGKTVQVQFAQFAALPAASRAFVAVLPADTKTVMVSAADANGRIFAARRLSTTFGAPDALPTSTTPTPPATSEPATTAHPRSTAIPPTTIPTTPPTSTPSPPPSPAAGCDGPGTGIGIADLGVGSGLVSFNYLPVGKTLCFSNGGPLRAAHRVPGAMPYAARTTLVAGQGVWGAVTRQVAQVTITDDNSPKGRSAQLLPLGGDLKVFVEETSGSVRLQAFGATGALLHTLTLG